MFIIQKKRLSPISIWKYQILFMQNTWFSQQQQLQQQLKDYIIHLLFGT